jgi:hypothetical protein
MKEETGASFIPHPSSLIPHPSSLILHPSSLSWTEQPFQMNHEYGGICRSLDARRIAPLTLFTPAIKLAKA